MVDRLTTTLRAFGLNPKEVLKNSALVFLPHSRGKDLVYHLFQVSLEKQALQSFAEDVLTVRSKLKEWDNELVEIAKKDGLTADQYVRRIINVKRKDKHH